MKNIRFHCKQIVKLIMQAIVLPIFYRYFCLKNKSIDENLVVLADGHNNSLPQSMKEIHSKILNTKYHMQYYFEDFSTLTAFQIIKSMLTYMEVYSRAKYVFICDNFLPVASCSKRADTIVVQLWHGGGALKKFGYDSKGDIPRYYLWNVFKNYDIVTVSAPSCIKPFASAMHIDALKVRALGISRTDCYYREDYKKKCIESFYKMYPDAIGKKILLWAPTFRGNLAHPTVPGYEEILTLEKMLGEQWKVIVKLHPHIKENWWGACELSTETLLFVIDFLITDYSSIVFDFLLFKKPFAFFVPDLSTYEKERGLYTELYFFPAALTRNAKELCHAVTRGWNAEEKTQAENCRIHFMEACDGNATKRILNEIGIHIF